MSKQRESVCVSGVVEARFGWNAFPRQRSGGLIGGLFDKEVSIDCDARAVFCKEDGTPISSVTEECCLYYGNRTMFDGAAVHLGDNQVGGKGDDEVIVLDLNKLPVQAEQVILTLDIFKEKKRIGTGKIQEAFVRIVDQKSGDELARTDISNLYSGSKMVIAGRIQLNGDSWVFVHEGVSVQTTDMNDFIYNTPKCSNF